MHDSRPTAPNATDQDRPDFAAEVRAELMALGDLLIAKNEACGDSALDPVRVFSQASPAEGIRVRVDDKLSRLTRGQDDGEDTLLDLIGYLVLLRIAERREAGHE